MKVHLVTPAPLGSRQGNRVTAERWARILRGLGHHVRVDQDFSGEPADLLLALHARRSAVAVGKYRRARPDSPVVLALTGTDLYRDLGRSAAARRALEIADRLVLLQPDGLRYLPKHVTDKARVIFQSVRKPDYAAAPLQRVFEVLVVGHLRAVKDPFRAARAARRLPAASTIQITHLGAALTPAMQRQAEAEMRVNSRYRWLGEKPRWRTLQLLARARLLVVSSKMEGGANVVSEAIVLGVPVVCTKISGSIGLLGQDYPGYFEVGDTDGLAGLLQRAEAEVVFYNALRSWCVRRRRLFDPHREQTAWRRLLAEL